MTVTLSVAYTPISHSTETLTGEVNNTDQRSAEKPLVLTVMWMLLWQVPPTYTPLQSKYAPSWQRHSLMVVHPPSARQRTLPHRKQHSGVAPGTWDSSRCQPGPQTPQITTWSSILEMCSKKSNPWRPYLATHRSPEALSARLSGSKLPWQREVERHNMRQAVLMLWLISGYNFTISIILLLHNYLSLTFGAKW